MKRKRGEIVETSPSSSDARPKRRRNDTTLMDTIQYVFDCLRNQRKEDDDIYLCEAFLRVPKKKAEPQYYDVVKQPIDMLKIQQKIKTDQYDELQQFCDDIQLLVENAKLYYAKSTEEYKDACELLTLYEESLARAPEEVKEKQKQKQQALDDDEKFSGRKRGRGARSARAPLIHEDSPTAMTQQDAVQQLFGAIVTARDSDDRLLSYVFRILPSKERYPEYYLVITKPIDLRTMAERICTEQYADLDALVGDFDLLFSNACQFNEPGSCIFKDAVKLRKFVHLRKQDLLDIIASGKGRLRCRAPTTGGGAWHSLMRDMNETTALPLADDEDLPDDAPHTTATSFAADDDDNDDDVDADNPMWQLFLLVKNLTVPTNPNYHLIEPFRRLPNRRWHADYYNEIQHPISISQIRKNIKKGEYTGVSAVMEDFNLMLNNAQAYNIPDSRIHRDAIILQAALKAAITPTMLEQEQAVIAARKIISTPSSKISRAQHTPQQVSGSGWADSDYSDGEDSRQSATSNSSNSNRRRGPPTPALSSLHLTSTTQLTFKRRAKLLFKTLMDYMTEDGRQPIVAFIEKPSRREYPDYYEVIDNPLDMEIIETRIKTDYYPSEKELLSDFRLMLKNCITYNEEGSIIHSDARMLDKVLTEKVNELNQSSGSSSSNESSASPFMSSGPAPVTPSPAHQYQPAYQLAAQSAGLTPGPAMSVTPNLAQSTKVLQLKKAKQQPPVGTMRNIKNVYNAVRDYRDNDGRQISDVFMKLPPKAAYPDYYDLIKEPIDLERILYKWKTGAYASVDDCLADLTLLFNNACRYNEPESQIYRDSLTLQQISVQKRLELVCQDVKVPRVRTLVQELLMSLFITVFNHEENNRYTAESFADLPSQDPVQQQQKSTEQQNASISSKNRPLTFDILKRRLDKGLYARLDHFQEDLFSIFSRARNLSSIGSRVYTDSITLQKCYLASRDKVCGSGKVLRSTALKYTVADLQAELEQIKTSRPEEDGTADLEIKQEVTGDSLSNSAVRHNETSYSVGDFVYAVPVDISQPKRILHVERLFRDTTRGKGNMQMIQGNHYYRPEDTFHTANRKFYSNEVFISNKSLTLPMSDIIGKCLVLSVNDFQRLKVEDIPEEDVFICESRYMVRQRFIKKIKQIPFGVPASAKLIKRESSLIMTKVDSIFKERMDRHKEELAEVDEETRVPRQPLPNVARTSTTGSDELEFEQYNLGSGTVVKLGDFVYVKVPPIVVPGSNSSSPSTLRAIRHVTRICLNPQGVCSFVGSVYSTSQELYMSGVQLDRTMAYKQEVYLTSVQDSLPLTDIIGRCSVLHVKEYAALRLTEVLEKDVYLCQNYFDETTRRISPLQNGITKFLLSRQVQQDEVYYFHYAVNLQKAVLETINLTALPRRLPPLQPQLGAGGAVPLAEDLAGDLMGAGDDSMDSNAAPSLSSGSTPPPAAASPAPSSAHSTPQHGTKSTVKKPRSKQVSGYLLFSSEIRKSVTVRNPSANFGEISRLVGMEWKKLCEVERKVFEDRAHVMNQEAAERFLLGLDPPPPPPHLEMPLPNNPDIVFECHWADCDVMFEDLSDMYEHLLNDETGHVTIKVINPPYQCQWRTCSRQKKHNLLPFPVVARLMRHCREVHLIKNTGRHIQPHDRSRNFIPSTRRSLVSGTPPAPLPSAVGGPITPGAAAPVGANTLPGFSLGSGGLQVSVVGGQTPSNTSGGGLAGLLQRQPPPIFVATPAKTQRLLHSEAYIKYIENLDKPYQSNWERHMNATVDNTVVNDAQRLPANWLPDSFTAPNDGVKQENGQKKDALQALWALRNLMMKDALCGGM